ncbi:MAG: Gfo/Idh/MocA family oxidoreductase [Calditrichaeota bacterium]|jgi:predicted dehydrogenase|nr:Gfo/Idh/MocA family oxidoreductase [Calditrichota bacterium]MBT7616781.1 Gfo/Idh/MocA family oxidoreductase [Calditrichota bacterium]MBT7787433.1 Gfo/Idh/MocA family oxidoreductase [Calditrichota bacterium]
MIKIGLAGVGYLGMRHLNHLTSLQNVQVSGIWDSDPETLERIATEFKVRAADSLDDLIENSDAVDVVTPTSTHFDVGSKVLKAGKPLFIEKPICATVDEGERLVQMAKENGTILQVGHIERFNRAFRSLNEVAVKPRFIEAHRLSTWSSRGVDVAVVHDLMIHDLDLILTLAQSEPVHVHANGVGVISDHVDIATTRIEFADGMVANVTASRISLKRMRKLRMFGENEYISLDMNKGTCEFVGATPDGETVPDDVQYLGALDIGTRHRGIFMRTTEAPEDDAMRLELTAFCNAITTGTTPVVSGEDGLKALKLAETIVKVINENLA